MEIDRHLNNFCRVYAQFLGVVRKERCNHAPQPDSGESTHKAVVTPKAIRERLVCALAIPLRRPSGQSWNHSQGGSSRSEDLECSLTVACGLIRSSCICAQAQACSSRCTARASLGNKPIIWLRVTRLSVMFSGQSNKQRHSFATCCSRDDLIAYGPASTIPCMRRDEQRLAAHSHLIGPGCSHNLQWIQ